MISKIEFEHGETTCAYAKGKFCKFLRTGDFGQKFSCGFFQVALFDDDNGWLERSAECMEVFTEDKAIEV